MPGIIPGETVSPEDPRAWADPFEFIDLAALRKRPVFVPTPSLYVGDSWGMGCFMDPPGYPTYLLRSVYRYGNSVPWTSAAYRNMKIKADAVITHNGQHYALYLHTDYDRVRDEEPNDRWKAMYALRDKRLHSLWLRPPLDHPLVQAWIEHVWRHQKNCYYDPRLPTSADRHTVIYPVPDWSWSLVYRASLPKMDPNWRTEYVAELHQRVAIDRFEALNRVRAVALPENHSAVRTIKQYYPEYPLAAYVARIEAEKALGVPGYSV